MSNRMKSLELMKQLQAFTQAGILPAPQANKITSEYAKNNLCPLKDFVFSPGIPIAYVGLLQNISKTFLS